MGEVEIFKYWCLDEVIDKDSVIKRLRKLSKDGSIEWILDNDILIITDIDLQEDEILELLKLFDCNDVFIYPDRDDIDDDDFYDDDEDDDF